MPGSEVVWSIKPLWDALEAHDLHWAALIHQAIFKLVEFQMAIDGYVG